MIQTQSSARTMLKTQRILVVEDEEALAVGVRDALEHAGFEVELAHDGPTALDRLRNQSYDLVVLDIMLESFTVGLFLALPIMLSALFVGLIVSVFQAITSIQEQTLVFIPKIIAVVVASIVFFSWMML